jgi:hypothetical protein
MYFRFEVNKESRHHESIFELGISGPAIAAVGPMPSGSVA